MEFLDQQIPALDAKAAACLDPHEQEIERLCTIPGVSVRSAEAILAAIGMDMSRFPSADHLVPWAGMSPASNESGGKRRPACTRHGNEMLKPTMMQASLAAGRRIGTYLGATYRMLAARFRRSAQSSAAMVASVGCLLPLNVSRGASAARSAVLSKVG